MIIFVYVVKLKKKFYSLKIVIYLFINYSFYFIVLHDTMVEKYCNKSSFNVNT